MPSVMRLMNRIPSLVLRSPLHRVMSDGILMISFTGRRSGHLYTIPVNYLHHGSEVLLTTDSPWWKNLRNGAPVVLRLRGRAVAGVAEPVTDEEAVGGAIAAMMARFPRYGRIIGVRRGPDGRPVPDELRAAIRNGRVLVRVHLVDGAATA